MRRRPIFPLVPYHHGYPQFTAYTFVCGRYQRHRIRAVLVVGDEYHRRTHEESDRKCHDAHRLLHWKLCGAVHVAGPVPSPVRPKIVSTILLTMTIYPFYRQNRNHVPWAVIGACYVSCMILLLIIRYYLVLENRRRDAEPPDTTYNDVYMEVALPDGTRVERKVEKVCFIHSMRFDTFERGDVSAC